MNIPYKSPINFKAWQEEMLAVSCKNFLKPQAEGFLK